MGKDEQLYRHRRWQAFRAWKLEGYPGALCFRGSYVSPSMANSAPDFTPTVSSDACSMLYVDEALGMVWDVRVDALVICSPKNCLEVVSHGVTKY